MLDTITHPDDHQTQLIHSVAGMSANMRKTTMRLGKKAQSPCGTLKMVDGEQDSCMLDTAIEAETDRSHVLLTTGLGLPIDGRVPLRLPALLVPALEIMQRYHDADMQPPRYLIYQATQFIAEVNNIASETASAVAIVMRGYVQHFIQRVYPDVARFVELQFDDAMPDISDDVTTIEQILTEDHKGIFAEHLAALTEGNRRSERELTSATRYAAANALLNGGHAHYPLGRQEHERVIMPIGGLREKPFFHISRLLSLGDAPVIPQLCQPGKAPTYYAYARGDITHTCSMDSAMAVDDLFADVKADYLLLQKLGLPVPDLYQLCNK